MEYRQVASSAFGEEDNLILLTPLSAGVKVLNIEDFVIGLKWVCFCNPSLACLCF